MDYVRIVEAMNLVLNALILLYLYQKEKLMMKESQYYNILKHTQVMKKTLFVTGAVEN